MHILIPSFIAAAVIGAIAWKAEFLLDTLIRYQQRRDKGYLRKLNPNAVCPGCGWKRGQLTYNAEIQKVVHVCNICNATWPENPRIPAGAWDYLGKQIKQDKDKSDSIREAFANANAPVVTSNKEKVQ